MGQPVSMEGGQAGLRILVVDDEEMVQRLMLRNLSRAGHQVTTAGSAEQALELYDGAEFDLVVTDQGLPAASGLELAADIRSRDPDARIILVTGWSAQSEAGPINYVLAKPHSSPALLAAIQSVMGEPE